MSCHLSYLSEETAKQKIARDDISYKVFTVFIVAIRGKLQRSINLKSTH